VTDCRCIVDVNWSGTGYEYLTKCYGIWQFYVKTRVNSRNGSSNNNWIQFIYLYLLNSYRIQLEFSTVGQMKKQLKTVQRLKINTYVQDILLSIRSRTSITLWQQWM
jgi:hypothetical protein